MNIYTIFDRKAGYCLPVFSLEHDTAATRQFTSIVVSSDTDISKYPADFDLICIAEFDIRSCQVVAVHPMRIIINGLVALTASNDERKQYKKVLEQQLDIEDFMKPDSLA